MASWNPALMPNTAADSVPESNTYTPISATVQHDESSSPQSPVENLASHDTTSSDEDVDESDSDHSYAIQPPTDADSRLPLSSDHTTQNSAGMPRNDRQSVIAPAAASTTLNNNQPAATASDPTANVAKHATSMSFARTVSHDVNWMDEEDGEWDLNRSDTDPFSSLMPENERTNSFPPVTPRAAEPQHTEPAKPAERALAHSQAEEIMNEVDHQHEDDDDLSAGATQGGADQTYVGGDAPPHESRFEEGLPLMPSHSQSEPNPEDSFGDTTAEGDDFFSQIHPAQPLERKSTMQAMGSIERPHEPIDSPEAKPAEAQADEPKEPTKDELAAKWAMEFADDDDFVLDDDKDGASAAFFGGDDEGLLDDLGTLAAPAAPSSRTMNGRSAPSNLVLEPPASGSGSAFGQPSPSWHPQVPNVYSQPPPAPSQSPYLGAHSLQPPRPEMPRAQSFVDKTKGGYHSPYDIPMDIVKPKKMPSAHHLPRAVSSPVPEPPPRSSSMGQTHPPQRRDSMSSNSSFGAQTLHPPGQTPVVKHKEAFFEELPISSRPRPASRHSLPSPSQASPYAAPQIHSEGPPHAPPQSLPHGVPSHSAYVPSPLSSPPTDPSVPPMANLVAPPRTGPYASAQGSLQPTIPLQAPSTARYSPAPAQGPPSGVVPPPSSSHYSPAPPISKAHTPGYMHSGTPILAHQPRTSSPLAHFEAGSEKPRVSSAPVGGEGPPGRVNSSGYAHPVNRIPSLPPTREVDEEVDMAPLRRPQQASSLSSSSSPTENRHPPLPGPPCRTPPLPVASHTLSPPKRGNYTPQAPPVHHRDFVPPPRSQTQSPGALYGNRPTSKAGDPIPRPSSVHGPTPVQSDSLYAPAPAQAAAPVVAMPLRPRGISQNFDLIPPTDGRETDPLQRWKGCPVFSWGVGGTIVTSFPQPIPRYGGVNSSRPSMVMSPGEVKVRSFKDVQPLEDRLAKFPGPLKGKSKKKETVAWLAAGIESLETKVPAISLQAHHTHDDKRAVERLLLWKVLRVFVEHDGNLEGSETIDKAIREILSPGLDAANSEVLPPIYSNGGIVATSIQSDAVEGSAIDKIRNLLLAGDRESAIWAAVDKRLWGHAMLIARTMPQELFMKVAQEFVRKEVNHPSGNNESLAALYGVFSGNFEECVDELVPVHARAGLQLMTTNTTSAPAKDVMEGLDKWRETLSLIVSNRTPADSQALASLGNVLSGYGRAEAAHICYLFARSHVVFSGLDDPASHFILVGGDHRRQAHHFAAETEVLLLSEVYEYGLSLAPGPNSGQVAPHLAAYKLQHAMTLAEYGHRDQALQYCEAIFNSISSQTRKSPYHHIVLENAVEDLLKRLRQSPKEESNSWIPKPSMTKMSDSLFKKFNTFVSGDDNEDSRTGSPTEAVESGPFARVASGTPTISRSPSVSNFDPYAGSNTQPPFAMPMPLSQSGSGPPTRTTSRYAPAAGHPVGSPSTPYQPSPGYAAAPRPSLERTSSEYSRSGYEPNGYAPPEPAVISPYGYPATNGVNQGSRQPSFSSPAKAEPPRPSSSQYQPTVGATPDTSAPLSYQPIPAPVGNYAPPQSVEDMSVPSSEPPAAVTDYQPPSYGYEPPSMAPATQETSDGEMGQNDGRVNTEETTSGAGYEPQSYGYDPPSYQPYQPDESDEDQDKAKPKKKTIFDDEDGDIAAPREKTKTENDKENEELFRKAAEEDAKQAEADKAQKQSNGWMSRMFGFGGAKKEEGPPAAVRAKLGESNQFVFDPELNRWINKKSGSEQSEAKSATPPPPRGAIRSVSGTTPPPMNGRASAPPPRSFTPTPSTLGQSPSRDNLQAPPLMMRSASNTSTSSLPPRPTTSLSNASSIDDLIGPAGPRKGPKKPRKSGRYIDVMAKN